MCVKNDPPDPDTSYVCFLLVSRIRPCWWQWHRSFRWSYMYWLLYRFSYCM